MFNTLTVTCTLRYVFIDAGVTTMW